MKKPEKFEVGTQVVMNRNSDAAIFKVVKHERFNVTLQYGNDRPQTIDSSFICGMVKPNGKKVFFK